jgi:hypothetical protein
MDWQVENLSILSSLYALYLKKTFRYFESFMRRLYLHASVASLLKNIEFTFSTAKDFSLMILVFYSLNSADNCQL